MRIPRTLKEANSSVDKQAKWFNKNTRNKKDTSDKVPDIQLSEDTTEQEEKVEMEWIKPDQQKEIEDQTQEQTGDTEMEQANYQMAIRSGAYNKEVN